MSCITFVVDSSQSPHTPTYTPTLKRKFKKKLFDTPRKTNLKKRIKLLQQTVRRQYTKINTLEVYIKKLENKINDYSETLMPDPDISAWPSRRKTISP